MTLFASLPMYDLPQVRQSTDTYWSAIRTSLQDHGFDAELLPARLLRNNDPHTDWLRNEMLLSQTCGLPYVKGLRGEVTLLGSPVYDLACEAGCYYSVIVGHRDYENRGLSDLAAGRVAYNGARSQSGYAAYFQYLADNGYSKFWGELIKSGSHLSSMEMVAEGKADFAAIDAVSFALASRHHSFCNELQSFAETAITPGLPYIASLNFAEQKDQFNSALVEAIDGLSKDVKDDLLLKGFVSRYDGDYDQVQVRWDKIVDLGFVTD